MGWGSTDTRLVIHDIVPPVALRAWRDPAPLAKAIGGINPIRAPRRKGTSRQPACLPAYQKTGRQGPEEYFRSE